MLAAKLVYVVQSLHADSGQEGVLGQPPSQPMLRVQRQCIAAQWLKEISLCML
jgi:hypothetical protein